MTAEVTNATSVERGGQTPAVTDQPRGRFRLIGRQIRTLPSGANRVFTVRAPAMALIRGPLPVWAALFVNVLAFSGLPTLLPIPTTVGQLVTQGALIVAFLLALLANPRGVIRPSLFLVLLSVLAVVALMVSIHNQFFLGSTFRACRLIGFMTVLWLLTPWWGRADFPLLRAHITCLRIVIVTVLVGAVLAPGAAFSYEGRLSGALWPIPPTQVAHYAAVLLGCTVVLWFGGAVRGRTALLTLHRVGSGPRRGAYSDRAPCHGRQLGRGRRKHVRGPRASSAYLGSARRVRCDRGHVLRTLDRHLAVAGAIPGGGDPAHRPYQGLDRNLGTTAPLAGGPLRIGTVQQVLQRPPD